MFNRYSYEYLLKIFLNYKCFQIVMDPMRALASLEFVSARGLDTADQGPSILANQVDAKTIKRL